MASYRYERDIDPKDLKPRKQRQYSRKERDRKSTRLNSSHIL